MRFLAKTKNEKEMLKAGLVNSVSLASEEVCKISEIAVKTV